MRSTTLSAHALLAGDRATRRAVAGKIVIVGSGWHQHAFGWYGDAGLVDLHPSPIGMIGGALMHDNFVEAILSGRIHSALPGWLLKTLEVLFGIGAAVLFFRYSGLGVQILTFGVLFVVLFVAQWLMMAAFYTYFDALVPLVGLALHSLGGRILEKKA
jgi:CHASE2 domain-containing sensor protein